MHLFLYATMILTGLTASTIAQIPSQVGFTTTNLFLPFAANGSYITALASGGPNNETTTYGIASSSRGLETPYLTVSLAPTAMLYNTSNTRTQSYDSINNISFSAVATASNCTFSTVTPRSSGGTKTHTARCTEQVRWVATNANVVNYRYTDLPEVIPSNLPSGFDGYVDVYVKVTTTEGGPSTATATVSSSMQMGGVAAAEVTAWVQAMVVVAAGAVALAV